MRLLQEQQASIRTTYVCYKNNMRQLLSYKKNAHFFSVPVKETTTPLKLVWDNFIYLYTSYLSIFIFHSVLNFSFFASYGLQLLTYVCIQLSLYFVIIIVLVTVHNTVCQLQSRFNFLKTFLHS